MEHSDEKGIYLNARDNFGRTVLIWACNDRKAQVVKLLLDNYKTKNIDVDARDNQGDAAISRAMKLRINGILDLFADYHQRRMKEKFLQKNNIYFSHL